MAGQHHEVFDQALLKFELVPDYDFNKKRQCQDLYNVTARVLIVMRDILKEVKHNVVLVHGDTITSPASTLGAFNLKIFVDHVEAGLRTHDIFSLFQICLIYSKLSYQEICGQNHLLG